MKCNQVETLLNAYIDGELSTEQLVSIEEHTQSCENCQQQLKALTQLKNTMHSRDLYSKAPIHLANNVSAKLKKEDTKLASIFGFATKFAYSLPALFLGLFIGLIGMSQFDNLDKQDGLLQSLTSAHINSLMADHLTDVSSSDSHAVKPWFHGQIDFSPPVHDFTQQGYPLIGGRLEYLLGRPTAALVYRHRRHTINLFIQPKSQQYLNGNSSELNGYHIIQWNDKSLSYSAVSDLNSVDLNHFMEILSDKLSLK